MLTSKPAGPRFDPYQAMAAKKAGPPPPQDHKSVTVRDFQGVNTQAHRSAIKDEQFAWLENVIPVGLGNLRAVPKEAASALWTSPSGDIETAHWGVLSTTSYVFVITSTGAAYQVKLSDGSQTVIAPAGTFSTSGVALAMWQNLYLLITDPANGYFSWDGTFLYGTGKIFSLEVSNAGINYTSAPTLVFTGGNGASATGTVLMTAISASPSAGGSGYSTADVLTISGGTSTLSTEFRVDGISGGGAVSTVSIVRGGVYSTLPANPAATTGGHGSSATLTISWGIGSANLTNPGSGYLSAPNVTVTGGGGTQAAVVATEFPAAPYTLPTVGNPQIATFQGRVWLSSGRQVFFTSANSITDFTSSSAGSFTLRDEVHSGIITSLTPANDFLYVATATAINTIGDLLVSGTPAVTTFSNVNISPTLGVAFPLGITPFLRAIVIVTPYGVYSLYGVTPQKISDDLDGIWTDIHLGHLMSSGQVSIYNQLCYVFLFHYHDPAGATRPLLALIVNGKWFFGSQGADLTQIISAGPDGTPDLYGAYGAVLKQLFSDETADIDTLIQTKLYDFGDPVFDKIMLRSNITALLAQSTPFTVQPVTELSGATIPPATSQNAITWINQDGDTVSWINNVSAPVTWFSGGFQINSFPLNSISKYWGQNITADAPGWKITALNYQFDVGADW